MTPQEIKAMIAANIDGQGNQVDLSGALPTILKEMVDMATPRNAPLKFTATGASTLGITNNGGNAPKLHKSSNGIDWEEWDYSTISLADGESVYIRGKNTAFSVSSAKYSKFTMSGSLKAEGNIMSLLSGYTGGLVPYCFYNLFNGCTSLTTAPELPATTLANYCYNYMFSGCTSLTTAPELPATALAQSCYSNMFSGCTSLTTAPELPATTLAVGCYTNMFNGCTSLTTAPSKLPATTLVDNCYASMFNGCTSLTTAPELPATALAQSCYSFMFGGCTSLTTAPELPATALIRECYNGMFTSCTSLAYVKHHIVSWSTSHTSNWLFGVAASGVVECPTDSTIPSDNNSGIPTGWTKQTF